MSIYGEYSEELEKNTFAGSFRRLQFLFHDQKDNPKYDKARKEITDWLKE